MVHHLSGPKHSIKTLSRSRSETQSHLSTQHREPRQKSARASERRQACEMNETPLRSSVLSFEIFVTAAKIVVAGERPNPGASSQHRHDAAHLRSCIVPENQFMALVDACRTRSWLFMFHLRLIEECDVEVLVAPSFRCDARVFLLLCRHAEPMRRFVVLRRRSSTALSRHTDSAKNCMACFRGCWIEMCCRKSSRVLAGPALLVAWHSPVMEVPVVVTTVEIVPMKHTPSISLQTADPSCAESARHATLRGLCRRWAASTRPHFPRRMGMSTSQASRGSRPSLLSSA